MKPYPTIHRRAGFTLVELLVVITLIALLGTLSIAVSRVAIESAKKTRTQMTIAKIDGALTAMYEKYPDKKVNLAPYLSKTHSTVTSAWYYDKCNYPQCDLWNFYGHNASAGFYIADPAQWTGPAAASRMRHNHALVPALWRLHLIRDMVRMDMPCWATEVFYGPVLPDGSPDSNTGRKTALLEIYQGALRSITGNNPNVIFSWSAAQHAQFNAELLFLVVMNGDPEARELFSDREVGDVNNNGLFEFIDGWGRPINWLRWAPGLGSIDRPFFNAMITELGVPGPASVCQDLAQLLARAAINTDTDRQYCGNNVYSGIFSANVPFPNHVPEVTAALERIGSAIRDDDDPFDPLGIDCLSPILDNNRLNSRSWLLVPYIFSSGPDGLQGINPGAFTCRNTDELPAFMRTVLYPFEYNLDCGKYETDAAGFLTNFHSDNIHNHKIAR